MKNKNIWTLVIVLIFFFGLFIAWQFSLYKKLSKEDLSCGGDWSYNAQCPVGSYCQSLREGPLAGGLCKPFLSSAFDSFIKTKPERTEVKKTNSCFCDLGAVTSNNCFSYMKPVCTTKFDCKCE